MKAKDKIKKAFEILGLPESSSEKEIKIAYRKLSLKWHPDSFNRNPDKHPAKSYEEATEKFKEIGWAKTVALKEEKVYDDYDDNNDSDYYYDSDYLERWRKMITDHLKRILEIWEVSLSEYKKIIREDIMTKKSDLDWKRYCEEFIDFENELKKIFSTEEMEQYERRCKAIIEFVRLIKDQKKDDKIFEDLEREKQKKSEWRSNYFSNNNDEWWEQEQENNRKFGEELKEEQNESYDTWKIKFDNRVKQEYIEDLESELLSNKISDKRLNQRLGVRDWKEEINKCIDWRAASDKKWDFVKVIGEMSREFICEKCRKKCSMYSPWTSSYDDKSEKSKFCSLDCVREWEKQEKKTWRDGSNKGRLTQEKIGVVIILVVFFTLFFTAYRKEKERHKNK